MHKQWILVDETTGMPIVVGSNGKTFRGEYGKLLSLVPPHKPEASGKVWIRLGKNECEFYAGVIGAKYVPVMS